MGTDDADETQMLQSQRGSGISFIVAAKLTIQEPSGHSRAASLRFSGRIPQGACHCSRGLADQRVQAVHF